MGTVGGRSVTAALGGLADGAVGGGLVGALADGAVGGGVADGPGGDVMAATVSPGSPAGAGRQEAMPSSKSVQRSMRSTWGGDVPEVSATQGKGTVTMAVQSNRMSPPGVVMTYVAEDEQTA
jgi:hypothetical protein